MSLKNVICAILTAAAVGAILPDTVTGASSNSPGHIEKDYPIAPVPFTAVRLTDDFWAHRIETNRKVSIPYCFGKCEEYGRMDNFAIAGGLMKGQHRGDFPFDDTDPYKILEGASYSLSVHPDPNLDKYLDHLITLIAAAQEDDGYLYTVRTSGYEKLRNWFGNKRWEKLDGSHELYDMGHLYEAAVAHYQATGKKTLLNVATKNADMLLTVFGPGKLEKAPGHQIIEMGLARLYRATGNRKYLDLAKFFLDVRGPGGSPYNQSHLKPVDQTEAVGHAVRASYMYCGMADVAALTGDVKYLKAIDRLWDNVVSKKLYLTGGIGATGSGEAFGKNYELPNETAYCETCAAIGNAMWNQRMFLFHGQARYIDVLERTLYNGLISGVSLQGDRFFYPNPLASSGQHERSPWFSCACCPGNMTRFIASVPGYVYAQKGDTVYVNLFVEGNGEVQLAGNPVKLTQQTRYPWDGKVVIAVAPKKARRFTLAVRIPGWAQNQPIPSDLYRFADKIDAQPSLSVNGKAAAIKQQDGYAVIERNWTDGDKIELDLPMPVRRVLANDAVDADRGRVALQRGPIVYCAEWPDNDHHVKDVVLGDDAKLSSEYKPDMLGGLTVVKAPAKVLTFDAEGSIAARQDHELVAIPYYAWAHRGRGEMAVWLARDENVVEPKLGPGVIGNASFEKSTNGKPTGFRSTTYSGQADFGYSGPGRTGDRCVTIESTSGADAGWFGSFAASPNTRYRLSGWIKTENLNAGSGKGALLNIHNIQPLQSKPVTGTTDWTRVEIEFNSGRNRTIEFNCLFGGWGRSTGKAWYDDLKVEKIDDSPTASNGEPTMYYADSDYGTPFAKDPDVVRFGGRYLMYYTVKRGAQGYAVGIARSSDLDHWKKVGELLPAGGCEKKGLAAPAAMVLDGKVHLFYQTYGNGPNDAICHAYSDDGLRFTRDSTNPVFSPSGAWNCGRAIDADVIRFGRRWLLYCATRDPDMKIQKLAVAAAPLGCDFSRKCWKQICDDSILEPELAWEKKCIEAPSLFVHDGRLYMFYAGAYNNEPQQIGVAVSDDGVSWKRLSDKPLLPNGSPGQWNSSESGHPGVFDDDDGRMYLFFQGNNDKGKSWHLSRMAIEWRGDKPVLVRPGDGHRFTLM